MSKGARQRKILEIIETHSVETQEELLALLEGSGVPTTQATISRDIRELRLYKAANAQGQTAYIQSVQSAPVDSQDRYRRIFANSVLKVDWALNNVVIICHTGTAGAACVALDSMKFDGVLGTLAGDDTIFIVTRNEEASQRLAEELKKL
ncbi:MAG: arginine repressor [Oscillospiraceae bacterium]|jgi:transcriptional regulator of arginine metabolism|nr:arginine repressor [Oscillospiraceae bacterium]